jgi:hypothetical protein
MSYPHPKEKDPLDPQTVFKIKHSEIPRGITQCKEHSWVKHSENELKCTKCPTVIIVDNIKNYV